MRHILSKVLSLLINKDNRKAFMCRIDPISRLKYRIDDLQHKLNSLEWRINLLSANNIPFEPWISYKSGVNSGQVQNYQEHIDNIERLKSGLCEEDKTLVDTILERLTIFEHNKLFIPELIYNKKELKEYISALEMQNKIIAYKEKGYYELNGKKLPSNEFLTCCFLHKNGLSKIKTLNNLDSNSVLVDVGAFIGDSAIAFREFSDNPIVSFEPLTSNYEKLLKTIKLNNLKNIIAEKYALGNENKDYKITQCAGGASITDDIQNTETEKITCLRFDDYVKKNNLKIGLIKVDTEGFEQQFLQGAKETICSQKPILLLSIYHNYSDFFKIKPWLESLNLGYKFSLFKGVDETTYPFYDIMLIAECY